MKRNRGGEKGKLNVVTCFLRVLCSSCPHPKSRMIKVIELFYSKQKRLELLIWRKEMADRRFDNCL